MKAAKVEGTSPSGGRLMKPEVKAADHAGKSEDCQKDPRGTADRIAFNRGPVEEQTTERNQCANARKQSGKQTRRRARTERKAMRSGKIARGPDGNDRQPD